MKCTSSQNCPMHGSACVPKKCSIGPDAFGKGGCNKERVGGSRFCEHHTEQVLKAAVGRRANWQ